MTEFANLVALGAAVGSALSERGLLLAGAESCTGGLVGHILTETPGSSAWYVGGAITYSNEAKVRVLGVNPAMLETEGAVSATCAAEMATGAQRLMGAHVGFAVTGIAGPGGGTETKPVGLVYVAVAGGDPKILTGGAPIVEEHLWPGTRTQNKLESAAAVLRLLLRELR